MSAAPVCADCSVRDRALCVSLDDGQLQALNRLGRRRTVRKGETIAWAGDDNMLCGNLLSGMIKLAAPGAQGREQIVGLLYPADFFGQPYADTSDVTATALADSELCLFPRDPFRALLDEHERMERLLLQRTMTTLSEARARMTMLGRKSAGERLAWFLLDLARRAESGACSAVPGGPLTFDLPLARAEIADILGLTIETVSRQLTKLKADGVIALPSMRAITIRDSAALAARAQG